MKDLQKSIDYFRSHLCFRDLRFGGEIPVGLVLLGRHPSKPEAQPDPEDGGKVWRDGEERRKICQL